MIGLYQGLQIHCTRLRVKPSESPLERALGFLLWNRFCSVDEPLSVGWGSGRHFRFKFKDTRGARTQIIMWSADHRVIASSTETDELRIDTTPQSLPHEEHLPGMIFHPYAISLFQCDKKYARIKNEGQLMSVKVDGVEMLAHHLHGMSLQIFDRRSFWEPLWRVEIDEEEEYE